MSCDLYFIIYDTFRLLLTTHTVTLLGSTGHNLRVEAPQKINPRGLERINWVGKKNKVLLCTFLFPHTKK